MPSISMFFGIIIRSSTTENTIHHIFTAHTKAITEYSIWMESL